MKEVATLEKEKYRDVWQVRLGADPAATARPMSVELVTGSEFQQRGGVRRYSEGQREFPHTEVEQMIRLGLATGERGYI